MKNLTQQELLIINGGDQGDYDAGYAAGQHVRAAIETVGDVISWFADVVDKLT